MALKRWKTAEQLLAEPTSLLPGLYKYEEK